MLGARSRPRFPWQGAAPTWPALAACLLLAAITPTDALGADVTAPRLSRLAQGGGAALVELASGERVEVALPAGARLEAAAALDRGWIAAGTAPIAGGDGRELLLLLGGSGATATSAGAPAISAGASTGGPAGRATAPAGLVTLPPPAGRTGRLRAEPLPLIEDGRLAGLVWLEGDDRRSLAVRFAAWEGASWSKPRLISSSGHGSQLALSAARLADGSWMLAWSAFDGHDDEIVWSRGRDGSWTRPRRLTDNQVPDVTPALTAAGDGALVAWSQLAADGYRLLVSRFEDGHWGPPAAIAAGGSLYPSFEPSLAADRLRLLHRTALPAGWAALELDLAGAPLRRAWIADAPPVPEAPPRATGALNRPALLAGPPAAGAGGPIFRWPGWPEAQPSPHPQDTAVEQTAAWAPAPPILPAEEVPAPKRAAGRPPAAKAAGGVFIAFGDSITAGFGDTTGQGYPGRLQAVLTANLGPSTVINAGLFGETTAEGLSRIGSGVLLQPGATALLLMEGTNDVSAKLSIDTIVNNLDLMAHKAEGRGIRVYHATLVPRLASAETDSNNRTTAALAGAIRELAWERSRGLADPFEVFFDLTPNYPKDYIGGNDKLHPNDAGYQLLAHVFAEVLEGRDHVPPVPGLISPFDGQQGVPASSSIQLDLFDFGAGIDLANTHLLINNQVVAAMPAGDQHKLEFRYHPPAPLAGVVNLGIETQDLANPPNVSNRNLAQFLVAGTVFLPGDLNRDGVVDGLDLLLFAPCFGAHRFDGNFRVECDLNGDGVVNGLDLAILAGNFGQQSF